MPVVWYIDDVMASLHACNVVDVAFGPRSDETKVCKISICCFSATHEAFFRSESKDGLGQNQVNVL